ncbi:glycosyltransferase family 25 protein [Acinetobacter sp. S40]|uniref:glycosyltransferase family 25 protein n=1 Tax=unclassified Acinetobacter TaxID=196816 RepID=UPI00190D8608|nr:MULTISPECIES: glycosyltransferase family 25 protein [unclassified Acinetobacter]MBJ9985531.1 glycosyltransferase family 25 protein [Acinetobacter sp. S40]MBK0064522.1 glycosyltransferase family 25 protein [Acinetobacter sp. S55]MBK0067931.1 glycosyltransferase family 25 protein [Acinetobacter sp. S54]
MKKYLISIESEDSKRLQGFYAQKTFYKYKDDFKQFGIIGKNLTVSEYFEQGVAGKSKPMTPGELGCTLSHLAALKDFLSSEESYAVIFEDDVIERFSIDFNVLEEQIKMMRLSPPLFLSLGGIQMKICRKVKGKDQKNLLLDQPVLKVDPFFYENLAYAYAYIVDREMAKILLNFHKPPKVYDQWADLTINSKQPFNIYVSYIFDHPQIENEKDKSYLENERDMMTITKKKSYSNSSYIVKKIRGFFLQTYKLNI